MVVIHPKPSLWNREYNSSRRPRRDASNLSNAESPSKRMRIAYEKSGGLTPESSRQREDYFLNTSPEVFGKLWGMSWITDSKEFAHEEVELGTVFERGDNWMQNLGKDVMRSLKVRQEYYQREPQHQIFKDRSKKLLDQSWREEIDIMVQSFKRALLCKNCGQHHHGEGLSFVAEVLRESLKTKDPLTINVATLDGYRNEAQKRGEDFLLELKEKAPNCKGARKMWRKKAGDGRDRGDSGVSITAELEKLKVECLYEKVNNEDAMQTEE
jgi:hypothetical protein